MTIVCDYVFQDQEVFLDFHNFQDCEFVRCNLIFQGLGPFQADGCTWTECQWTLAGPAQNTMEFLGMLFRQGGDGAQLAEHFVALARSGGAAQQMPAPAMPVKAMPATPKG